MFVVVEGLPKADPDVEQAEATTEAANEAGGHQRAQPRVGEQKIVVGPLGSPGKDNEQDSSYGADEDEKEN